MHGSSQRSNPDMGVDKDKTSGKDSPTRDTPPPRNNSFASLATSGSIFHAMSSSSSSTTSSSSSSSSTSSSSSSSASSSSCSSGLFYQVHIRVSGKVFELGVFAHEDDAARAHDRALIRAIGPHELHAFWALQVNHLAYVHLP